MRVQPRNVEEIAYSYDTIGDALYFKLKKNNYSFSEAIDGAIFDFNKKRELISVEILNATRFFGVTKTMLQNIARVDAVTTIRKNKIVLQVKIQSHLRNERRQKTTKDEFFTESVLEPQKVLLATP